MTTMTATTVTKVSQNSTSALQDALDAAISRFTAANPKSASQHQTAISSLPGGNTRATLHTSPFPVYITSGKGTTVTTADGAVLTDFVGELSAGLFGHSHPVIRSAIISTFDTIGMCLGGTTEAESLHAALICQRFGVERLRFTNSGTEANLSALVAARHFTNRSKIVMFNASYHGGVLFVYPDGTVAPNTVNAQDIIVLKYNDIEDVKRFFATPGAQNVAAVLVELIQGFGGIGDPEFLLCLQRCTKAAGALLIVDEVMTSRLAPKGFQSKIPYLKPDITIFGKYLGGGFGIGAFGGREDVMQVYDPRRAGGLIHMGTFNQNTMAMNVGYKALKELFTPEVCLQLNETGDRLRTRLNTVTMGTKLGFVGVGSVILFHATKEGMRGSEIKNATDFEELELIRDLFWFEMLEEGFWVARRGGMTLMLGMPQEELDRYVSAVEKFVKRHEDSVTL